MAQSFQFADQVFVGRVMRVDNIQSPNKFIFQVAQSLKGVSLTPTEIFGGDTNCHRTFDPGGTYIVYARNEDGKLFADACMSTAQVFTGALNTTIGPPMQAAPSEAGASSWSVDFDVTCNWLSRGLLLAPRGITNRCMRATGACLS
jgi:hypothetical protein